MHDNSTNHSETTHESSAVAELITGNTLVPVVALPNGYGLLPLTLSIVQVGTWIGLGKTKVQELINANAIATAKVDGRTLVLTSSVIALINDNRVKRGR